MIIIFIIFPYSTLIHCSYSEIMILSGCKNFKDGFIKNEYILRFRKIFNDKKLYL